ncbi:MAG TPA: hypothetical protein VN364_00485 [Bellilinea sp.]|nr:hypothetical protein [Bellilinea sp.]
MNKSNQRILSFLILTVLALMLGGCTDTLPNPSGIAPNPGSNGSVDPNYAYSQATIDAGQRQLLDLSIMATQNKQNMDQAEDAAALSTLEYEQRRKLELDFQSTLVSQNIAMAAATQEFFVQQTAVAMQAIAEVESHAATITQLAIQANATQTAQAQLVLDARVQQTAQAVAALTAYPLTATPLAATEAALLLQQYDREQQAFLDRLVVPLLPYAAAIILLLFIGLVVIANRRTARPIPWLYRLREGRGRGQIQPTRIIEGVEVNPDRLENEPFQSEQILPNSPHLPDENPAKIEIVNATEIPIAHWVYEVESRLNAEGRLPL